MTREIALIYNPSAGKGKASRRKKKVENCLRAANVPYTLFETESEAHLIDIASNVVHEYPLIVGAGGDTTISIIANQILRAKKDNTLGIIGLGSINDLAREIGVLKLEDACLAINIGRTITMDVGKIKANNHENPSFFLAQASLGLGVEVNRYVEEWMNKHTFMSRFFLIAQSLAAVKGFFHSYRHKIVPVNLNLKQKDSSADVFSPFIIFSNTSILGKNFRLTPNASPTDGKLDCCIINAATFPNFVDIVIKVKRQKHLEFEGVKIFQDVNFKIQAPNPLAIQMDGEILETDGEFEVSAVPRALKLIVSPEFKNQD